jgi:hypothetical protein
MEQVAGKDHHLNANDSYLQGRQFLRSSACFPQATSKPVTGSDLLEMFQKNWSLPPVLR